MSTIQVLDKIFEPYLKEAAIQEKITELAGQLKLSLFLFMLLIDKCLYYFCLIRHSPVHSPLRIY